MKIRVAVCQVDMEWEHTARNLERLEPIVAAADADIAVLPEMFATGFKLRPARVAEPADGLVASTMRRWAAQYGKAVVGSVVIAENGEFRNRMFFVKPSGGVAWYDKRHLFRPGGEARDYTPGNRRVVVEYMGFRFLLLICYDLRFPELYRGLGEIDLILMPAAFTEITGRAHWEILLRARAIENQCYVLAIGQGGVHENRRETHGNSMLIDPWGDIVARRDKGAGVVVGELDHARIAEVRTSLPALTHRVL